MSALTMALKNEDMLGMIYKVQDDDWPSGRAHFVMTNSMENYQLMERIPDVEIQFKLNKVKLEKNTLEKLLCN